MNCTLEDAKRKIAELQQQVQVWEGIVEEIKRTGNWEREVHLAYEQYRQRVCGGNHYAGEPTQDLYVLAIKMAQTLDGKPT